MTDQPTPTEALDGAAKPATLGDALARIAELEAEIAANNERGVRLATFFLNDRIPNSTPTELLDLIGQMLKDLLADYGFSPPGGEHWIRIKERRFGLPAGAAVGQPDEQAIERATAAGGDIPAYVVEASDGRPFFVIPLSLISDPDDPYGWLGIELAPGEVPSELATSTVLAVTSWIWQHLDRAASIAEARRGAQIARVAARAQMLMARPLELDDALRQVAEALHDCDDLLGVVAVRLAGDRPAVVTQWGDVDAELSIKAAAKADGYSSNDCAAVLPVSVDGAIEGAIVLRSTSGAATHSDEMLATIAGAVGGSVARHRATETIEMLRRSATRQLIEAQERERSMIAADVHDGVLQQLGATAIRLELAQAQVERSDFAAAREIIEDGAKEIRSCARELRSLLMELRPQVLDDNGLSAALKELGRNVDDVTIEVSTEVPDDLGNEYSITIFRIVQEALTNIQKHAHAKHARVDVHLSDGSIEIEITDDGIGFEAAVTGPSAEGSHLGLLGMRERADMLGGTFSIEGRSGSGTRIVAVLPLKEEDEDAAGAEADDSSGQ